MLHITYAAHIIVKIVVFTMLSLYELTGCVNHFGASGTCVNDKYRTNYPWFLHDFYSFTMFFYGFHCYNELKSVGLLYVYVYIAQVIGEI